MLSVPNYISVYAVGVEIMNHCSFLCFVVVIVCFVFFNGFMVHLSTFLTQMFGGFFWGASSCPEVGEAYP